MVTPPTPSFSVNMLGKFYLATSKDDICYIIRRSFFPVTYIFSFNYSFILVLHILYVHVLVFKETSWYLCTSDTWHIRNLFINNPFNYCFQACSVYTLPTIPFCILSSGGIQRSHPFLVAFLVELQYILTLTLTLNVSFYFIYGIMVLFIYMYEY